MILAGVKVSHESNLAQCSVLLNSPTNARKTVEKSQKESTKRTMFLFPILFRPVCFSSQESPVDYPWRCAPIDPATAAIACRTFITRITNLSRWVHQLHVCPITCDSILAMQQLTRDGWTFFRSAARIHRSWDNSRKMDWNKETSHDEYLVEKKPRPYRRTRFSG